MDERKLNPSFTTHFICEKENEYRWDIYFSAKKKMINQSALFWNISEEHNGAGNRTAVLTFSGLLQNETKPYTCRGQKCNNWTQL